MNTPTQQAPLIEKGVPIPAPAVRPRTTVYGQMEVGDSVFFPCDDPSAVKRQKDHQYSAAKYYTRVNGWGFTGRVVEGGFRIWRTK